MVNDVKASELSHATQAEKDQYVWVDVRTDEEYASGHVPNAIHIPHDEMDRRADELVDVKEKPILLVCRSGKRSMIAAEVLHSKGFRQLYNLKGGMLEWTGERQE